MGGIESVRWPTTAGIVTLGQAEVEQLRARLREHDVARLEVSMDDARAMCLVERTRDLDRAPERLVERQRAPRQTSGERLAVEDLHHQKGSVTFTSDVVQRADVRMSECGDRPRFPFEPLAQLRGPRRTLRRAP